MGEREGVGNGQQKKISRWIFLLARCCTQKQKRLVQLLCSVDVRFILAFDFHRLQQMISVRLIGGDFHHDEKVKRER